MNASDEATVHDEHLTQKTELVHEQLSRLVGQLRNGCGKTQCRNILCHTGRSNTSRHPTRRYTIQAARVVAFDVYTSQNRVPESLFCQHYTPLVEASGTSNKVRGHDFGSLPQSMGNTQVFRQIDAASVPLRIADNANLVNCAHWHQKLDNLKGLALTQPRLGEAVSSNAELEAVFVPCLKWLVSQIPVDSFEKIIAVQEHLHNVGMALASLEPRKSDRPEGILHAWDAIHNVELLDLFERVIVAISSRSMMEDFIREKLDCLDPKPKTIKERAIRRWPDREELFEIAFFSRSKWAVIDAYTLYVWLQVLFFKFWNGSADLGEAPHCLQIANMMHYAILFSKVVTEPPADKLQTMTYMPRLALELDAAKAAQIWLSMRAFERTRQHVFSRQVFFEDAQLLTFFRHVNLLTMR
jgi:hypothetical protein